MLQDSNKSEPIKPLSQLGPAPVDLKVTVPKPLSQLAPKPLAPVPKPEPIKTKVITKVVDFKLPAAPRDCVEQILEYELLGKQVKIVVPPDQPSVGLELTGSETITLSYINGSGYCGSRVQINSLS